MLFQGVITAIGAWLGAFLGGTDSLLYAIVAFTIIDYATGILAAINAHKLSSSVGFRGIARKILIFALIGLAHLLDVHILGTPECYAPPPSSSTYPTRASPSWKTLHC